MPDPDEPGLSIEDAARRRAARKAMDRIEWGDRLPNLGDISQARVQDLPPVDILGAGFPCQDFSIAGLRASLDGARGSLSVIGTRLLLEAAELGLVRGAVLEQVPDVLNTPDNAWGNILGALVGADAALAGLEHGGKWPRAGMVAGPPLYPRKAERNHPARHSPSGRTGSEAYTAEDLLPGMNTDPSPPSEGDLLKALKEILAYETMQEQFRLPGCPPGYPMNVIASVARHAIRKAESRGKGA
jgi:hypothetical protein